MNVFTGLVLGLAAIVIAIEIGTLWAGLIAGALMVVLPVWGFMNEIGG